MYHFFFQVKCYTHSIPLLSQNINVFNKMLINNRSCRKTFSSLFYQPGCYAVFTKSRRHMLTWLNLLQSSNYLCKIHCNNILPDTSNLPLGCFRSWFSNSSTHFPLSFTVICSSYDVLPQVFITMCDDPTNTKIAALSTVTNWSERTSTPLADRRLKRLWPEDLAQ